MSNNSWTKTTGALEWEDLLEETYVVDEQELEQEEKQTAIQKEAMRNFVEEAFQPVSSDCMAAVKKKESNETEQMGKVYRRLKAIELEEAEEAWLGRAMSRTKKAERLAKKCAVYLKTLFVWYYRTKDKAYARLPKKLKSRLT